MKFLILVCSLCAMLFSPWSLDAQSNLEDSIHLQICMHGEDLAFNKRYILHGTEDSIEITRLRFYLSDLVFLKAGEEVATLEKKYLLIDIENEQSLHIPFDIGDDFDAITFNIGIDSATNMAGAQGADLDPMRGMYWTWQSGYINFKLEGKSALCPTRKNQFQFHIGGYSGSQNALQKVQLAVSEERSDRLVLQVALDTFLGQIDLEENHTLMSPGTQAVKMANMLPQLFSIDTQ